jgi:uncharacterized protein (TIRG00374 family)
MSLAPRRPALGKLNQQPYDETAEWSAVDGDAPAVNGHAPGGDANGGDAPDSLRARIFRPRTLVSFGIAVALLIFFFRRLNIDLGQVWANVQNANPLLYLVAFVVYYLTFVARAYRWRWMLSQAGVNRKHGYDVPTIPTFVEMFLLSWFANCVVPAKLGDAYRSYLLKRECGASFSTALGTILAERLVDLTVLFSVMSLAGLVAFRGHLPGEAQKTLIGGLILLVVGVIGLTLLWLLRERLEGRMPLRIRDQFGRLHDAVFTCVRRPGKTLALSVSIWFGDGIRLFLVALALGEHLSLPTAAFVALMSSLLTTLPITPAGLGVVEGAMIVVLKLVGVESSMAGSITLLDRVVTYWSLILIGLILYLRRVHSEVSASQPVEKRVSVS